MIKEYYNNNNNNQFIYTVPLFVTSLKTTLTQKAGEDVPTALKSTTTSIKKIEVEKLQMERLLKVKSN